MERISFRQHRWKIYPALVQSVRSTNIKIIHMTYSSTNVNLFMCFEYKYLPIINYSFWSLLSPTSKETWKFRIIGSLWRKSTKKTEDRRWPIRRKTTPCYQVIRPHFDLWNREKTFYCNDNINTVYEMIDNTNLVYWHKLPYEYSIFRSVQICV